MPGTVPISQPSTSYFRSLGQFLALTSLAALMVPASFAATPASASWSSGDRPSRADAPVPKGARTPRVKNTVVDPFDDTFGTGVPQLDLISLGALAGDDVLTIELIFAAPVSAPDSGAPDALDGFIDLDTDQDGTTGDVPWTDFLRPGDDETGMGNEYYVDFFGYDATTQTVQVIDDATETVAGLAAITFLDSTVRVEIPLSVIGDDTSVDVATIVGTLAEPTDLAPNLGSVSSTEQAGVLLQNDRFRVTVAWRDFAGKEGIGRVVNRSDDSVVYYFFSADNWEMLLKILNGCENNDHYWVFFAAVTNVEFTVTVIDTLSDQERVYTNQLGQSADAITDSSAFATCP